MAAKSKPVEKIDLATLELTAEQNLEFVTIENVESSKAGEKIVDEGEAFNQIIEKLKELKAI